MSYKDLYLQEKERYLDIKSGGGSLISPGFYFIFYNSKMVNAEPITESENKEVVTKEQISKRKQDMNNFLNLLKGNDHFQKNIPSFEDIATALPVSYIVGNNEKINKLIQTSKKTAYFTRMQELILGKDKIKKLKDSVTENVKKTLAKRNIKIDDKLLNVESTFPTKQGDQKFELKYTTIGKHYGGNNTKFKEELEKTNNLAEKILKESKGVMDSYLILEISIKQNKLLYSKTFTSLQTSLETSLQKGGRLYNLMSNVGCYFINFLKLTFYIAIIIVLCFLNLLSSPFEIILFESEFYDEVSKTFAYSKCTS